MIKIRQKRPRRDAWGCNSIFSRNEQISPHASLCGRFLANFHHLFIGFQVARMRTHVYTCCVHTSEIVVGIEFEFISFIDLLFTTKENFGSMCSTHEYSCVHMCLCTRVLCTQCVHKHMCTHVYRGQHWSEVSIPSDLAS